MFTIHNTLQRHLHSLEWIREVTVLFFSTSLSSKAGSGIVSLGQSLFWGLCFLFLHGATNCVNLDARVKISQPWFPAPERERDMLGNVKKSKSKLCRAGHLNNNILKSAGSAGQLFIACRMMQ